MRNQSIHSKFYPHNGDGAVLAKHVAAGEKHQKAADLATDKSYKHYHQRMATRHTKFGTVKESIDEGFSPEEATEFAPVLEAAVDLTQNAHFMSAAAREGKSALLHTKAKHAHMKASEYHHDEINKHMEKSAPNMDKVQKHQDAADIHDKQAKVHGFFAHRLGGVNESVGPGHKLALAAHQATLDADSDDSAHGADLGGGSHEGHSSIAKHQKAMDAHHAAAEHYYSTGHHDSAHNHKQYAAMHRDHLIQMGHIQGKPSWEQKESTDIDEGKTADSYSVAARGSSDIGAHMKAFNAHTAAAKRTNTTDGIIAGKPAYHKARAAYHARKMEKLGSALREWKTEVKEEAELNEATAQSDIGKQAYAATSSAKSKADHLAARELHQQAASHHRTTAVAAAATERAAHQNSVKYHVGHANMHLDLANSLKEETELDEAVETGNPGHGYHGQSPEKYSATHAHVKKIVGAEGHLAAVKTPNKLIKHYLDSAHGRHLAGMEHDHGYIKRDFKRFTKGYRADQFEAYTPDEESLTEWRTLKVGETDAAKARGELAVKKNAEGSKECPYCKAMGKVHSVLNHIKKESTDLSDCLVLEGLSEEELNEWGKPTNINLKITQAAARAVKKNREGDRDGQQKALQRVRDLKAAEMQEETINEVSSGNAQHGMEDHEQGAHSEYMKKRHNVTTKYHGSDEVSYHGSKENVKKAVLTHYGKSGHADAKELHPHLFEAVEEVNLDEGLKLIIKPTLSDPDRKNLSSFVQSLRKSRPSDVAHGNSFSYRGSKVTFHDPKTLKRTNESFVDLGSLDEATEDGADDAQETKRLEQLIRLGLMDSSKLSVVRRAFKKLSASQAISNPQERAALLELLGDLISLVTGDDSTFAKVKVQVGHQ
jgi:hypothetical protein